ncbi:MAG: PorV/PorQ family protein [Candidatus Kryptoniota bacterium]
MTGKYLKSLSGGLIVSPSWIFTILFFLTGVVHSQTEQAQVGFRFLENPVSAEAMGKGGSGVATITNSNAIFWNPAGTGWIEKSIDLNISYTRGIASINYFAPALGVKLGTFGVLVLDGIFMDYGQFYGTRRADNADGYIETGTFSPQAFALGVGFSQKVSDHFSYGVHIKYAYQNLGSAWISTAGTGISDPNLQITSIKYSHGEPAFDVGAYYDFLFHGIKFGASLQNVSRQITYEQQSFLMPFAVNFGLTVEPISFLTEDNAKSRALVISVESTHPRDFRESLHFGAEYTFANMLSLRSGYMLGLDERGFTAGIGLKEGLAGSELHVDYAFEPFGVFGAVHYMSVGLTY